MPMKTASGQALEFDEAAGRSNVWKLCEIDTFL